MRRLLFISIFSLMVVACGGGSAESDLTNVTWKWSELHETEPAAQSLVPDSDNYTIEFKEDGSLSVKADCNNASGSYTLEGENLTLQLGPSTLAECGETSLYNQYLTNLGMISSYSVEGDRLTLNLQNDAGRLVFTQ